MDESFISNIDNELLISLVERNTLLWDKTSELHKNRMATQAAWNDILRTLMPELDVEDRIRQAYVKQIMHRWIHIRDNYGRSCRKIEEQISLGSTKVTKPYVYSRHLQFLNKTRQTTSMNNVKIEFDDIDSEDSESNVTETSSVLNNEAVNSPNRAPKRSVISNITSEDTKRRSVDTYAINEHRVINRHLSFFHGILPSLDDLDEEEVLEFQMGVLQLLKKIKSVRQNRNLSTDPLT